MRPILRIVLPKELGEPIAVHTLRVPVKALHEMEATSEPSTMLPKECSTCAPLEYCFKCQDCGRSDVPAREPGEPAVCPCRRCDDARRNAAIAPKFIVCPLCGNKRCPHATSHVFPCTGSNEPGQKGSDYE